MPNETELRQKILELLAAIAPEIESESDIEPDQDLREQVDLDSMDFLNFITSLSEHFRIDIPQGDYGDLVSFNDFVTYLSAPADSG